MCPGICPGLKCHLGRLFPQWLGRLSSAPVARFAPARGPWAFVPIGINPPSMVKVQHRRREMSSVFENFFQKNLAPIYSSAQRIHQPLPSASRSHSQKTLVGFSVTVIPREHSTRHRMAFPAFQTIGRMASLSRQLSASALSQKDASASRRMDRAKASAFGHILHIPPSYEYIIPHPGQNVNAFLKKFFYFFYKKGLTNPRWSVII